MRPLIDGDILAYELGGLTDDDDLPVSWDMTESALRNRIDEICWACGGTEPPTLYFTGKTNFRAAIATTKPYKGTRKHEKPFHWANIRAYLTAHYESRMVEGLEADDLLAIAQTAAVEDGDPHSTVICSRDKDLRMVPGWHYGWECGRQREFALQYVTSDGELHYTPGPDGKAGKLTGTGMSFFYSQLLTGDSVDNIPGVPRVGPKKAWEILSQAKDLDEMWDLVKQTYEEKDLCQEYLEEQANLLWMVRHLEFNGNPVMFQPPTQIET